MTTLRIFAAGVLLFAGRGFSQVSAPAFEAASIKPSNEGEGHTGSHSRTGYLVVQNQNLRELIRTAYRLRADQVSGGPKWVTSARFNIEAKSAGPAEGPELLAMLQTLLADRFQLTFHKESALLPGFALVVAKGGLKVRPVDGSGGSRSNSNSDSNRRHLSAEALPMAKFAETLSRILGSPVVDKTGATGAFTFELEWSADTGAAAPPDGAPANIADAGPSIFTALQEKLGVKLEAQKVPTEIFVIDKAEKPSEN